MAVFGNTNAPTFGLHMPMAQVSGTLFGQLFGQHVVHLRPCGIISGVAMSLFSGKLFGQLFGQLSGHRVGIFGQLFGHL